MGWFLALFLLVVPAPVLGGVEWTMQAVEPAGWTQPIGVEGRRLDRTLDGARRWIGTGDDGSIFQLRGSEWT